MAAHSHKPSPLFEEAVARLFVDLRVQFLFRLVVWGQHRPGLGRLTAEQITTSMYKDHCIMSIPLIASGCCLRHGSREAPSHPTLV